LFSTLLDSLAEVLDIPDHLHEEAVEKYTDLGQWLEDEDADLKRRPPEIYPQGSFRLGTMIRPLSDQDEYDIDLVYKRDLQKQSTTQAELKQEAGANLANYVEEKSRQNGDRPRLSEKCRCWTLTYPDRFHMDVLPAIPDGDGNTNDILITDRELTRWQHSDPIDYAEWFKSRMAIRFNEKRIVMAQSIRASVETVPEWRVKTPLQRAIQILKRHRDVRFADDCDDRPASIIIATLAARAYDNEADVHEALTKLVREMPKHIQKRSGLYWIPNPVNPQENFADRWVERPQRAEKFLLWLKAVDADLAGALAKGELATFSERLAASFGAGAVNEALNRTVSIVKTGTALRSEVPALADCRHREEPPWPIQEQDKVKITGSVRKNHGESKELWKLSSRAVPKGIWLRFQLSTSVRKPYDVRWQVVNTGREAAA